MKIPFFKYQGTGNDFILIDNRRDIFSKKDAKHIASLCDRRFGIGADGLILLENDRSSHFEMVYYNADGREGSMCGNGGRCTVAFAKFLGMINGEANFKAVDGIHVATIDKDMVSLAMGEVSEIMSRQDAFFLDTGSPHHVQSVKDLKKFDVLGEGKRLRYGLYGKTGSNINFVEQLGEDAFSVRTYERGVEDETLSCGTGVTAVALAMHRSGKTTSKEVQVTTRGGELKVRFETNEGKYHNVQLIGPAKQVFKGEVEC